MNKKCKVYKRNKPAQVASDFLAKPLLHPDIKQCEVLPIK